MASVAGEAPVAVSRHECCYAIGRLRTHDLQPQSSRKLRQLVEYELPKCEGKRAWHGITVSQQSDHAPDFLVGQIEGYDAVGQMDHCRRRKQRRSESRLR